MLLANLAHTKLAYGDLEGTKTDMDAAQTLLDSLPSVENRVRADYYKVSADYYKAKAEYAPYYRNSLLFLACIELSDLENDERILRAHDLSISALLGDTIYNFGELVRYWLKLLVPILTMLTAYASHSGYTERHAV